jgi:chromosome partitioning protein
MILWDHVIPQNHIARNHIANIRLSSLKFRRAIAIPISGDLIMTERKKQIRICVASNAGGSGKTTSSVHLAYGVAKKGYKVTIIELDVSGSLMTFTGLDEPRSDYSLATVFEPEFAGQYPLIPVWENHLEGVTVIQGGEPVQLAIRAINRSDRGVYILKDRLDDYPLDVDVVIMDTPASLETMAPIGLAASTHVLSPIKPETKDVEGFAGFIRWHNQQIKNLRLQPKPEFLGFIPIRVRLDMAMHRNILGIDNKGKPQPDLEVSETLPGVLERMGIRCFPYVKESSFYMNASFQRLPVGLYRPNISAAQDFDAVVQAVVDEMK